MMSIRRESHTTNTTLCCRNFLLIVVMVHSIVSCTAWMTIPSSSSSSSVSPSRRPPYCKKNKATTSCHRSVTQLLWMAPPNNEEVDINSRDNGDDDDDDPEERKRRRMAMVRQIQMSYYLSAEKQAQESSAKEGTTFVSSSSSLSSTTSSYHPTLDSATGIVLNVPLWRVQWTEVPGRSNVLNVHEPIYTNMFEKILYGPKPWLVGHLYLPEGSKNLNKQQEQDNENEDPYRLRSWQEEAHLRKEKQIINQEEEEEEQQSSDEEDNEDNDEDVSSSSSSSRSSVVGSLLKISDFRRMADGRLLLLVHAMQRFVVIGVQQQLPYSIADIQLLPDVEEIDPHYLQWDGGKMMTTTTTQFNESDIVTARAMAIEESIRYQEYEYDPEHVLPIQDKVDLDITDILGSNIARVLPFCPYSKTLDPPTPTTQGSRSIRAASQQEAKEEEIASSTISSASRIKKFYSYTDDRGSLLPTLESRLLDSGILRYPPSHPEVLTPRANLTMRELEYELWLAINHYLITTKTPVSPILLGLLPPDMDFPSHFVLQPIVADLNQLPDTVQHDFVPVPVTYPELRRQQRLSYSAAHLLEQTEWGKDIRQILLETPSTHARLRMVLERFDMLHSSNWGEFQ